MNHLPTPNSRWAAATGSSILLGLLLTAGCGGESIRVYSVDKEVAPREHAEATELPPGELPHAHWDTPAAWKEEPAGGIRVARFTVPGEGDTKADVSVIPLPGVTAPRLDIVNLWREQIQLPRLTEEEAGKLGQPTTVGTNTGELFDMVSTQPILSGSNHARILVAMAPVDGVMWFVKMTGDDKLVTAQKNVFTEFLKSLKFHAGDDEGHRPAARMASTNTRTTPASEALPEWTIPEGWQSQPPTAMVLARFAIQHSSSGKADVSVSAFPGAVGGTLGNINRWRGQIGLPPVTQADLAGLVHPLNEAGKDALLVDMTGPAGNSSNPNAVRMVAAIVPRADKTWFYKLMGDEAVVGRQKDSFVSFVQSVRYPNGP